MKHGVRCVREADSGGEQAAPPTGANAVRNQTNPFNGDEGVEIGVTPCPFSPSLAEWPDLRKFHHFGKIWKVFGQFFGWLII